jgi:hypothetical protein
MHLFPKKYAITQRSEVRRLRRPQTIQRAPRNRAKDLFRFFLSETVHHVLKRAIVGGVIGWAVPDQVISDIQPFHVAGMIAPHLTIPETPLRNRLILLF